MVTEAAEGCLSIFNWHFHPPNGRPCRGLPSAIMWGLRMPGLLQLLVSHNQGGRAWGPSVPGKPGTRAVASGTEVPALPHQRVQFTVAKCCHFSLKLEPLSCKRRGERSWASARCTSISLSLPQESPSSPSIAKMNGSCTAGFIKYEWVAAHGPHAVTHPLHLWQLLRRTHCAKGRRGPCLPLQTDTAQQGQGSGLQLPLMESHSWAPMQSKCSALKV